MEGRLGKALHSAHEFVAKFRRTPFERFQHGQMSMKELNQMTHGGSDLVRRIEAAHLATKDLPPGLERTQAIYRAIAESDIANSRDASQHAKNSDKNLKK